MIRSGLFIVACAALAAPAFAHHGPGTFELNKTVTFDSATLTKIELLNPHGWIYFDNKEADGRITKHRCEMRSAHTLRRSGWTPDLFKVGAKMKVTASPDRADVASCYLNTIEFENGNRMDRYGQYVKGKGGSVTEVRGQVNKPDVTRRAARRPTGEPNITGDWAPEQVVMADPRGTGGGLVPLSRIGERGATPPAPAPRAGGPPAGAPGAAPAGGAAAAGAGRRAGGAGGAGRGGARQWRGAELTELGQQDAAAFRNIEDNPRMQCLTTSILFDWTFDGPVNRITQNTDTIVIQYGQLGLKRTIYMNMKAHPARVTPSRAGHSIGRWEKDVLVVDTIGFLPGVLEAPTRHSDKLHVVERFSLDPQTNRLTRSYTAEDPVYLKGQGSGSDVVEVADAPYAPDNCKDQGRIDYSKQVSK